MNIQRLRNLTTGRLHTKMSDIYEDIEWITGEKGVMTHMLPNALKAILPFLKDKISDNKFFNGNHDPSHIGEIEISPMNDSERAEFWDRYKNLPSIFE